LPENSGMYRIEIIDIMGRSIRIYERISKSGHLMWNGTNENNQVVASGVYCVLVIGNNQPPLSKRIVLLK
jgi:hypothetical protein